MLLFGSQQNHLWQLCSVLSKSSAEVKNTHLSEGDDPLLGAHDTALEHQEIVVDLTVVGETSHGGDALLRQVIVCGGVVLDHL